MDTPQGHEQNADQIAYWNGPGGQRWADRQAAQACRATSPFDKLQGLVGVLEMLEGGKTRQLA